MKTILKTVRRILPHVCVVFSLMFIVLIILHAYNPYMGFIAGTLSLWCQAAFCVAALATGIALIVADRRRDSSDMDENKKE